MTKEQDAVDRCVSVGGWRPAVRLTEAERTVFNALSAICPSEEHAVGFLPVCKESGLDRAAVRRACRSMARKGVLRFERGLWTEDGEPAGSGYGLTRAGVHYFWNQPSINLATQPGEEQ